MTKDRAEKGGHAESAPTGDRVTGPEPPGTEPARDEEEPGAIAEASRRVKRETQEIEEKSEADRGS